MIFFVFCLINLSFGYSDIKFPVGGSRIGYPDVCEPTICNGFFNLFHKSPIYGDHPVILNQYFSEYHDRENQRYALILDHPTDKTIIWITSRGSYQYSRGECSRILISHSIFERLDIVPEYLDINDELDLGLESRYFGNIYYGFSPCKSVYDFDPESRMVLMKNVFRIPDICNPNSPLDSYLDRIFYI